jgi:aspartyl-tRNA(Asn)/glutamyl-tRNA(Gln) amidotransferase subunit B
MAPDSESVMVVVERGQDDYVLSVGERGADVVRALVHVKEAYADQGSQPTVPAGDLAGLILLETSGKLTSTQAKQILADVVSAGGGDAAALAAARGFEAMDESALVGLVEQVIASQAEAWSKFCAGEDKAMGALVGAVMKASQGKADGKAVTALLVSRRTS